MRDRFPLLVAALLAFGVAAVWLFSEAGRRGTFAEPMSTYRSAEDLINIGAYVKGSNPKIDYALSKIDQVNEFLKQGTFEKIGFEDTVRKVMAIFR